MGTVSEKLDYLLETKNLIKEALTNKNIDVANDATFRSYAGIVEQIPGQWTTGKNLFNQAGSAGTGVYNQGGLEVRYLYEENCFYLNGALTTGSAQAVLYAYINPLIDALDKSFVASAFPLSGTIDRSTATGSTSCAIYYFGKGDTPNAAANFFSISLQDTYSKSAKPSVCDKNYITRGWFYISPGVIFDNYKVRIQLEEAEEASDTWEPFSGGKPVYVAYPYFM